MSETPVPGPRRSVLLHVDHVSRTYPDGSVTALDDVSLEICRGEYVAIMGPSGSGKSTLLNLLGALDQPSRGKILFEGESLARVDRLDQFRARSVGFVFQSFCLLPTLNALENVQIPMFEGKLKAADRAARAAQLLESVGMAHRARHRPNQLSVGERQRVAIARALANDPPLLLADEPTGNLDSHSGAEVLDLFDQLHRQRGVTLVVITHSADVAQWSERTILLRDGRIASAVATRAAGSGT